jgi:hypothetical protein
MTSLAACLVTACLSAPAAAPDWVLGMEELYRLDRLPLLRQSVKVASVSSYDRTGGNDDGFSGTYSFVRKEADGLVIADLKGPGIIYRFWTPTPSDDMVEFYFDGEKTPRIAVKFRDIFLGKTAPFFAPLVGYGAGGFFSYVPLPFRTSCTVFVRAKRVQFYQLNYALYPTEAPIATYEATPSAACLAAQEKARAFLASPGTDVTSYAVRDASALRTVATKATLAPGATTTIFTGSQGGRIAGIRFSPRDAFAGKARAITLAVYFDGEKTPSVLCPAGDFFGYAFGEPASRALLFGTNDDVNYAYFPMPFSSTARIDLIAEPTLEAPHAIQAEVVWAAVPRQANEGAFYACWHRENPTTAGTPFTFLATQGRGHIVGVTQQSQGMESGNTYFFEGDDQTTIDGELAIHGTGSEDFYNGGWYDVPGRWETRMSFPLSGCLLYKKHLGRTGAYRIFLGDAYAYTKSITQAIEHAPTGNTLLNDYTGVTYFYAAERPAALPELPPPPARAVVDLARIVYAVWWNVPIYAFSFQHMTLTKSGEKFDGQDVRFLSIVAEGEDWFGEPFIIFTCEIPAAGRYRVSIDAVKGPAQGKVRLFVDEAPVGVEADLRAETRTKASRVALAELDLREGPNNLVFKLVGATEKEKRQALDLINIVCEKVK